MSSDPRPLNQSSGVQFRPGCEPSPYFDIYETAGDESFPMDAHGFWVGLHACATPGCEFAITNRLRDGKRCPICACPARAANAEGVGG